MVMIYDALAGDSTAGELSVFETHLTDSLNVFMFNLEIRILIERATGIEKAVLKMMKHSTGNDYRGSEFLSVNVVAPLPIVLCFYHLVDIFLRLTGGLGKCKILPTHDDRLSCVSMTDTPGREQKSGLSS